MESSLPAGFRPKKISLNVGVLIKLMLGLRRNSTGRAPLWCSAAFRIRQAKDPTHAPDRRDMVAAQDPNAWRRSRFGRVLRCESQARPRGTKPPNVLGPARGSRAELAGVAGAPVRCRWRRRAATGRAPRGAAYSGQTAAWSHDCAADRKKACGKKKLEKKSSKLNGVNKKHL